MKRFIFLGLVLSALLSFGQNRKEIPLENPRNYSVKRFGTDSLDRGMFLIKNANDFLLIGLTYNVNPQLMLSGVNSDAEVKWNKIYPSKNFQFAFAGTSNREGVIILSGYAAGKTRDLDAFVTRVNFLGDTLWTRKIGGPQGDRGYKVINTKDGNFVVIGQTLSFGNGGIDSFIIKINKDGNIIWQRTFGTDKMERTYSGIELDNGELIISGIANEDYPKNSEMLVMKLSADGDLIWKNVTETPKGEIAHSLHRLKDNTYFIVGYTAEKSDSISDPMIVHMNEKGETLGKHIMVTGEDVRLINGFVTEDNQYVRTGFSKKTLKSDSELLLVKFNFKTSKMTLKKVSVSAKDEEGYHAQPIDNNTALIVGHTLDGNGDILLIKWDHAKGT